MGLVEAMTEDEFKTNYVRSYLAAYQSAVTWFKSGNTVDSSDRLLALAKQNAERAWQEYTKTNDSLG